MIHYRYLIIGGGMTADYAVQGIRKVDDSGTIGMITNERHAPYKRPPLSKALWKGEPLESIWLKSAQNAATIHTSCAATRLLTREKQVVDQNGDVYTFDKLLLATGGKARRLPYDVEGIIYFRTADDYEALRRSAGKGTTAIVIGGGFNGAEIAAALAMNGVHVTMLFPEAGIGARVYPARLSAYLNEFYASKGVAVMANDGVAAISREGATYRLRTSAGVELRAETLVAGIGIQADTALAQSGALDVENGIVVNEFLQTSNPDIYSAGDVANFFSPQLEKRVRLEHEDNAKTMGLHAGRNMAGEHAPYHHLSYFYSDLFELGYEAVGELSPQFEIVENWKVEFQEGVVYYLDNERVQGVLLWNTWDQVDNARALIAGKKTFTPETVKGELPR
jgi:3-phenylpropionate/trans-cinnamate dioxygenase ferredoxin reductase subunit